MDISNFIYHSESIVVNNLSLVLEKVLNDKLVLTDEEKKQLEDIMKTVYLLEKKINNFDTED